MIGRTLAHKNVSTTAIYARLNLDPVREAMQKKSRKTSSSDLKLARRRYREARNLAKEA